MVLDRGKEMMMGWHGYRRGVAGVVLVLLGIGGAIVPSWGQQEGGAARTASFAGTVMGTMENALVLRTAYAKSPDFLVPVQEKTLIYLDNVLVYLSEISPGGHAQVSQSDGLTSRIDIRTPKRDKDGKDIKDGKGGKDGKDGKDSKEEEDLSRRPILTGVVTKNENNTLSLRIGWGANAREEAVTVSDETVVRSEGEKIPVAKLAVGQTVTAIRKDGKAVRVMVQPPKKK